MEGIKNLILVICSIVGSTIMAADWQWSVKVNAFISPETKDSPRAFLWIPPECNRVNAVIVGQHNMLEEGILEHLTFRQKMSSLGIAEIWITPGISQNWDPKTNIQQIFNEMLDSLASISGYTELKYTPIIPIGHSAMATFPWNFAAQNNDRTLAVLSVHGDAPGTNLTGYGRANLDWDNLKIDGIPGLMVEGEYEWWEARVQPALEYKKEHPNSCVSFLCDAGRGHFDYSDQMVDYLALFIEKAIKYRLPKQVDNNKPVQLITVNPQNGWLANRWHVDSLPDAKAAPFKKYQGNSVNAFWYFDKEIARKTEAIYTHKRGKKQQYLGYSSKNMLIPYNSKHFYGYLPEFKPDSDGVTFHLSATFTDSLHVIKSDKHAQTKSVITRVCGPVTKMNDTTFRVQFYRMGMDNPKRTADICLMVSNNGDKMYKSAVQQCLIKIPYPLNKGKEQMITFDSIPNISSKTKTLPFRASSTSGLKIYYYVLDGPAKVIGDKLIISKIPKRAKFPVRITVVAWQYGITAGNKYQTALPVTRQFFIENRN